MRALIDTCVVIDALQNREPFYTPAQDLLLRIADRQCDGFISAKSLTDIYYIMHRFFHSDTKCRKLISSLTESLTVLDTSGGDCLRALASKVKDFEDAVMIETAVSNKMDCIITRNIKDYANSPVAVYPPEDIVNFLIR